MIDFFRPVAHQHIGESLRPDSEKRSIIGQRIVDFAIGDPVRHHHIGGGMCLRKHILDLIAGFYIPFRDTVRSHHFFLIRL